MVASIWNPGPTIAPPVAAGTGITAESQTLTLGQTVITLGTFSYTVGAKALYVYLNGVLQTLGADYSESSSTTVTLTNPASTVIPDTITLVGTVAVASTSQTVTRIAVMSDSLTMQNSILDENIPQIVQRVLNQMNVPCTVVSIGRDGHTFYRANTVVISNGLTATQALIAYAPDIVLIPLGANDTVNANIVDNRTLAQVKADADTTIAAIKTALPATKIIYVSEVPYDTVNFPVVSALKNKGLFPSHQTLRSSGILSGYYSSEILEDVVAAGTSARYQNWKDFDTYVKSNAQLYGTFNLNLWRVQRMGGCGNDSMHLTHGGLILGAGYIVQGLRSFGVLFPAMIDNNFGYWNDPDFLFSQLLTPAADGYIPSRQVTSVDQNIMTGRDLHLDTWYLPLDTTVTFNTNLTDSGSDIYAWRIAGGEAGQAVKASSNGNAFVTLSNIVDSAGNAGAMSAGSDIGGFNVGTNTVRYAVGNICLPPQPVTFAAQTITWNAPTLLNSWAAVSPGTNSPVGYSINRFKEVRLRGVVSGGATGTLAFVLPVGYRPAYTVYPAASGAALAYWQINANGDVYAFGSGNVTLDGVTFPTV